MATMFYFLNSYFKVDVKPDVSDDISGEQCVFEGNKQYKMDIITHEHKITVETMILNETPKSNKLKFIVVLLIEVSVQ